MPARRSPADAGELVVALAGEDPRQLLLVVGQDVHAVVAGRLDARASWSTTCRRRTPPAAGRATPRRTTRRTCPTGPVGPGGGDHGDPGREVPEHLAVPGAVDGRRGADGSALTSGTLATGDGPSDAGPPREPADPATVSRRSETVRPSYAAMTSHSPVGSAAVAGVGQERVDGVVVVGRVVVEQGQALGPGLVRPRTPRSRPCSGPSSTSAANSSAVYWASWMTRSAPSHSSSTASLTVVAAVVGHLVVGQVGDRGAADLDPVAVVGPDVGDGPHPHLGAVDLDVAVGHVVERDLPVQLLDRHREERRPHELVERLGQRPGLLRRAVDVEAGARAPGSGRRTAAPARGPSACG